MHPGIFQWVKRLRDGIVLVVSLLTAIEGPGSLEQMVDVSLFAWLDCRGAALHLLIIPRSHKRNPNIA